MPSNSTNTLTIGEPDCASAIPFFAPLKKAFPQPAFRFVKGTPAELNLALEKGKLDVALTSSILYAQRPEEFLILPGVGISTHGPMRSALFFSDMLLDDLDEMTISLSGSSVTAATVMQLVLDKYLQYSVNYIAGWGEAEGYLLIGDSALRERLLDRYAYVYDVGELWRHYTEHSLVFSLWLVRQGVAEKKADLVALLQRSLLHSLESAQVEPESLLPACKHLSWLPKSKLLDHWSKIHYKLSEQDITGFKRLIEDAYEYDLIETLPELEYFQE